MTGARDAATGVAAQQQDDKKVAKRAGTKGPRNPLRPRQLPQSQGQGPPGRQGRLQTQESQSADQCISASQILMYGQGSMLHLIPCSNVVQSSLV